MSNKKLDSYSMLICTKYFKTNQDFLNVISVCKKFQETTEKLRFNPIPITSLKLFPNIQTQYLYTKNDIKIQGIDKYEIWFEIDYDQYFNVEKQNNLSYHHITYKLENRWKYGDIIPKEVNALDKKCFEWSETKTITIPNNITSIANDCFDYCSELININLSNNVTNLSNHCFDSCVSLPSIVIPSSVISIGNSCFHYCTSLIFIDIPNTVTSIGSSCFNSCEQVQSLTLPTTLYSLKEATFYFCSALTNIALPSTITSIGNNCFSYCLKLKSITLPNLLQHIGIECFSNCGIQSIQLPNSLSLIGVDCFIGCTSLSSLNRLKNSKQFTFKVSYNDSLLYNQFGIECTNIVLTKNDVNKQMTNNQEQKPIEYIVPNGIKEILDGAFSNQQEIYKIELPTTLITIHNQSFFQMTTLQTINIPNNVKTIGNYAFAHCNSLTNISFPSILPSFGISCFKNCTKLIQTLNLPDHSL